MSVIQQVLVLTIVFAGTFSAGCLRPVYNEVPAALVCVEDCQPVTYTGCDVRRRCCVEITVARPSAWWGEHTWGPCDDVAWSTNDPNGLCVSVGQMCPPETQHMADPYFGCASNPDLCCDREQFEGARGDWPSCD